MDSPYYRSTPKREREKNRFMTREIHELQDERTEQQKKVFTKWVNAVLSKREKPVDDLYEEIKDGDLLLELLQALTGKKLWKSENNLLSESTIHHRAKIKEVLNFIENNRVKLVNVTAASIADGVPKLVLGLIWQIILHFQITEAISHVSLPTKASQPDTVDSSSPKPDDSDHLDQRNRLLAWVRGILAREPGKAYHVDVQDFGRSWRDGKAFNVLLLNLTPQTQAEDLRVIRNVLDDVAESEEAASAFRFHGKLQFAFITAEEKMGVARLLEPEDVDVDQPDERSIMMYVAQFAKVQQLQEQQKEHSKTTPQDQSSIDDSAIDQQQEDQENTLLDQPIGSAIEQQQEQQQEQLLDENEPHDQASVNGVADTPYLQNIEEDNEHEHEQEHGELENNKEEPVEKAQSMDDEQELQNDEIPETVNEEVNEGEQNELLGEQESGQLNDDKSALEQTNYSFPVEEYESNNNNSNETGGRNDDQISVDEQSQSSDYQGEDACPEDMETKTDSSEAGDENIEADLISEEKRFFDLQEPFTHQSKDNDFEDPDLEEDTLSDNRNPDVMEEDEYYNNTNLSQREPIHGGDFPTPTTTEISSQSLNTYNFLIAILAVYIALLLLHGYGRLDNT